jgi:uncharacterized protein
VSVEFPIISPAHGAAPRIRSLLIKPVSALCNLDCAYCFYLDRDADPYSALPARRMTEETIERLIDSYLFYSYPNSTFAFQGGEPTLAGPAFYENVVKLQQRFGRGQSVANAMQTNGLLLDERWCELFKEYKWLIGISIDGPEEQHDRYRYNKQGAGSWRKVITAIELLKKHGVEFNVLCVLSQANVGKSGEIYRFFRSLGIDYIQYIPLSEFDASGKPLPFTITPEQYGRFLCETFDVWWPDRRKVRIRYFDNIAEALAGQKPSTCTMHETCDSYLVVEFNGDVYPCEVGQRQRGLLAGDRAEATALSVRGEEDDRPSGMHDLRVSVHLPQWVPETPARSERKVRRSGLLLHGVQNDFREGG